MDQPENGLALIVMHHKPLANRNHQNYNEIFAIFFGPMENSYMFDGVFNVLNKFLIIYLPYHHFQKVYRVCRLTNPPIKPMGFDSFLSMNRFELVVLLFSYNPAGLCSICRNFFVSYLEIIYQSESKLLPFGRHTYL